jgi:hypothetical protein
VESVNSYEHWLQVAGCRLQVAGCRLQVAGCRLQVAGFKINNAILGKLLIYLESGFQIRE